MKIMIVDDDVLVQKAIEGIVVAGGHEVVAKASDGSEVLDLYERECPDMVLMDIRMAGDNGIEGSRNILNADPGAKILLITTFNDEEYIEQAINLGCRGYILKQNIAGILPAIEAAFSGQMVFDSHIGEKLHSVSSKGDLRALSDRERDVLTLIADGLNNKEIADRLYLSEGTVRNYISSMLAKLELRDRTQLAIYYLKGKL